MTENVTKVDLGRNAYGSNKKCSVVECLRPRRAKGYCTLHYYRLKRTGSVDHVKWGEGLRWVEQHASYTEDRCLIWPFSRDAKGYPNQITWNGKTHKAHRVMCSIVNGSPRPDEQCCHSCGNGHMGCINPKHLRWGSADDNAKDRIDHGRSKRGESHHKTKFTKEQVIEIKRQLAAGRRATDIARELNVSKKTIGGISEGRVWAWLEAAP